MVSLKNITKTYGSVYALRNISLEISDGEWVSVMGPSGSGKTTLLHIIGGLEKPSEGEALVHGYPLHSLEEEKLIIFRREVVGFVFQHFYLVPYLTALENVMLAQYFHSIPDAREALEILKQVGLEHRAQHLPSQLSGGEMQRVAFARAVVNQPKILLLDEPTGNLDAESEERIMELVKTFHKRGHTIIVATHDPHIGGMAERVILLEHGVLKEDSSL